MFEGTYEWLVQPQTILMFLIIVLIRICAQLGRSRSDPRYDSLVVEVNTYDDDEDEETVEPVEENPVKTTGLFGRKLAIEPTGRNRYIRKVYYRVNARFGCPVYNRANRAAVRQYAVKLMQEDGHRPSHISRDINRVVTMSFIPSDEFRESVEVGNDWVKPENHATHRNIHEGGC
jgi:hypothetical protein